MKNSDISLQIEAMGWGVMKSIYDSPNYYMDNPPKGKVLWTARKSYETEYAGVVSDVTIHLVGNDYRVISSTENRMTVPYDDDEGTFSTMEAALEKALEVCKKKDKAWGKS